MQNENGVLAVQEDFGNALVDKYAPVWDKKYRSKGESIWVCTPRISKELVQNFERKCGATICKDLKGIGTGKVLCPCPECVRNAVFSLGEVLGK